jgi:hypothetical protein
MARKPETDSVCGLEIPVEQRTPLVDALLHVIEQLQATNQQLQTTVHRQQLRIEQLEEEIRRLKGLPAATVPNAPASGKSLPSQSHSFAIIRPAWENLLHMRRICRN